MKRNCALFLIEIIGIMGAFGVSGCSTWNPYRPQINQGNVITSDVIERLKVGMTSDQVQAILGTPVTKDIFQPQRWEYLNYNSKTGDKIKVRRFTLWFDHDHLVRWESEGWQGVPASSDVETPPSSAPDGSAAKPSTMGHSTGSGDK